MSENSLIYLVCNIRTDLPISAKSDTLVNNFQNLLDAEDWKKIAIFDAYPYFIIRW